VEGQPYNIEHGKLFLFFFQSRPASLVFDSAKRRRNSEWGQNAAWVRCPSEMPQYAPSFLADTGLKAGGEFGFSDLLKRTFGYTPRTRRVVIDNGREKAALPGLK